MEPDQLRKFRTKYKLTQAKLAELLLTTGNTIARWERGERAIPPYLSLALKAIETELSKNKK